MRVVSSKLDGVLAELMPSEVTWTRPKRAFRNVIAERYFGNRCLVLATSGTYQIFLPGKGYFHRGIYSSQIQTFWSVAYLGCVLKGLLS